MTTPDISHVQPPAEHGYTNRPWLRRLRAIVALAVLRLIRTLAQQFPHIQPDRLLKLVGAIDGYGWAPAVSIRDSRFGRSMTIPAIQRIHVDGKVGTTSPRELDPVATNVFGGFEPFDFNVSFACGRSNWLNPAPYGNPHSPWFNVFVGYYELDVSAELWKRPFGYTRNAAGEFGVCIDDLSRLVDADWNYFSNYMYGVPLSAITRIHPTPRPDEWSIAPRAQIGQRSWDHVLVSGTEVCSAYLGPDGAGLEDNDWILNDIWRASFGEPYRAKTVSAQDPETSFVPTSMSGELMMCFDHERATDTYRTFIFGGSVNDWWAAHGEIADQRVEFNAEFMKLQMSTVEALILKKFTNIGF